jgi:hypothetical protein
MSLLDWSEVWALFIPIIILFLTREFAKSSKPVIFYLFLAVILNFAEDYIWKNGIKFSFSTQPGDNNFIYNTHSIVIILLFSWFFICIKQPILSGVKKIIPVIYIVFVFINFSKFEKFTDFSSRTLGLEAGLLLFYCLIYYLNVLLQDQSIIYKKPEFWIITGLSIYVVVNFPIFLFYNYFALKFENFAIDIWDVHNIAYIIFCIFIAKAFLLQKHE